MPEQSDIMLVVERGVPGVQAFPLDQDVSLLGASQSSDIFLDNPYVSRMHAQIIQEQDGWAIRDLDSKNGTFVNGVRLRDEGRLLESGDRIELAEGQVVLRFLKRGATVTMSSTAAKESGDLLVDSKTREVWVLGKKIETSLSRKEFDVLDLLNKRRGEACSKDEIAAVGWPERDTGDVGDQEIEQSIRRLRLRIEPDPSNPRFIITIRGYGYKLAQQ